MIVYRTMDAKELIKVMLGETIFGQMQKSFNCYDFIKGKEISMRDAKKFYCCAFLEPLFYQGHKPKNIMVALDVPDDEIVFGYGDYYSSIYNSYIDGDPWYINGEYGANLKFRSMIKTRVKEAHLKQYDIKNVVKVYFPYDVKSSTELGYHYIECEKYTFLQFLDEYLWEISKKCLINGMQHKYRHKKLPYFRKDFTMSLLKKFIKMDLEFNKDLERLNFPFNDVFRVIDSFEYFSGRDFSAKLDRPQTLNYMLRSLDYGEIARLLEDMFVGGNLYEMEFVELPEVVDVNDHFKDCYLKLCVEAKRREGLWKPFVENDVEIKKFLYALLIDSKII